MTKKYVILRESEESPIADAIWHAKAEAAFILAEEIKLRKAAVEALKKFVHYEPWMDGHADDVQVSTFKCHTFGDLRAAKAIIEASALPPADGKTP